MTREYRLENSINILKSLGLAVVASAIVGQAVAADLPSRKTPINPYLAPVSAYNWSGVYWGSQFGYASMIASQNEIDYLPALRGYLAGPNTAFTASGLLVGSHLGYLAQFNSFVAGIEADFDGSFAKAGRVYNTPNASTGFQRVDLNNYLRGTLRGRLGFAFDRVMPYITGGMALGAFQMIETSGFGAAEARKFTRLGWTLGGGVEYAINDVWSAKVEYRYSDYGRLGMTTYTAMPGNQFSTRVTDNEARVGFTYHWRGWGGGPVVASY